MRRGAVICTDFLPESGVMSEMMARAGLRTYFEQDDQDYYIVMARRP